MNPKNITVTIRADTRELRRQPIRADLLFQRSWLRRRRLRFALWRSSREEAPWTVAAWTDDQPLESEAHE